MSDAITSAAAIVSVIDSDAATAIVAISGGDVVDSGAGANGGTSGVGSGGDNNSGNNISNVVAIPLRKSQQWVIPASTTETSTTPTPTTPWTALRTTSAQGGISINISPTPSAMTIRDQKIAEEDQRRAIALEGNPSWMEPLLIDPT